MLAGSTRESILPGRHYIICAKMDRKSGQPLGSTAEGVDMDVQDIWSGYTLVDMLTQGKPAKA